MSKQSSLPIRSCAPEYAAGTTRRGRPWALLPLSLLLGACGLQPDEEAFAIATASSTLENGSEVANDSIESADCTLDAVKIAENIAAREPEWWSPKTCITKTADGPRVHAELDNCRGRLGRSVFSGGLDAALSVENECKLLVDIQDSGDLEANHAPLDYAATALVTPKDDLRLVEWSAEWTGKNPRGRSIHNTTSLNIETTRSTGCRSIEGGAEGTVDEHEYELGIAGLKLCPDACPTAGEVEASVQGRRKEYTLHITFDGSAQAHVVGWSGDEFDVELDCEPTAGG